MAKLGYVGLGVMGGRMAKRLMDAGHTVTGYNRTKSKADWLLAAGMQWADSPREVAQAAASHHRVEQLPDRPVAQVVGQFRAVHAVLQGPGAVPVGCPAVGDQQPGDEFPRAFRQPRRGGIHIVFGPRLRHGLYVAAL